MTPKRLRDLNPKLEGTLADGVLRFDCPLGHAHKLRIPVGASGWQASGSFPDSLTLQPSINTAVEFNRRHFPPGATYESTCGWHGFITNGGVA